MRRASYAALVAALAVFASSPALSQAPEDDDAYWQGRRGPVWQQGPDRNLGLSNWYTKPPPKGRMSRPARDVAAFAKDPASLEVWIDAKDPQASPYTFVNLIYVLADADRYDFKLLERAEFKLGRPDVRSGVRSDTPNTPNFELRPGSVFSVEANARFVSPEGVISAVFFIDRAMLRFGGTSAGGNAQVGMRGGLLAFDEGASAQDMQITFGSPAYQEASKVQFLERSTPGDAAISVLNFGVLELFKTRGPAEDGELTAKSLASSGAIDLGTNTLKIKEGFTNTGNLVVKARDSRIGNFVVKGMANLGGKLIVLPVNDGKPLKSGSYRVITAKGGRTGGFFFDNRFVPPGTRLENLPDAVNMIVP